MSMLMGPDVSSNNPHPIDWHKVKAAGFDFAIVKATQGVTYQNPAFKEDYLGAKLAGLIVGPYHWPSPLTPASKQAENFLDHIRGIYDPTHDLPCWLDYEESGVAHSKLDDIRRLIQSTGYRTGTYTFPYFWKKNGDPNCQECASDPLWYASYQSFWPAAPAPWREVALWQFAGTSYTVPGIGGRNDMSRAQDSVIRALTVAQTPQGLGEDVDMAQWWHDPENKDSEWALTATTKRRLASPDERRAFQNAGLLERTDAPRVIDTPVKRTMFNLVKEV